MEKWAIDSIIKKLQRELDSHFAAAFVNSEPLKQMLMDDPNKTIDLIVKAYNQGLNQAYTDAEGKNQRAFIESFAGGPHEAVPSAIYNAVGAVYPYLDRKQRDKALEKIVYEILDGINMCYIQISHTPYIREPLLLSDIGIVRSSYWPGLHNEEHLWKNKSFFEFQEEVMTEEGLFNPKKVRSDFLVAYAVLRTDFTNWGEEYAKVANPQFFERVLQGIVALRFSFREREKPEDIEKRTKRLKEILPESLHDRIEPLRQKNDWADFFAFNRYYLQSHQEYALPGELY